jgi:ribosomal protein S18 acetylase RimI-like enzyme
MEALWVLYRRTPAAFRRRLVEQASEDARRGELDLSGLWLARRGERVVGAILTQLLGGRAGAVWPPEVSLTWGRSAVAGALVRAGLEGLAQRGARIAQALLTPDTPRQAGLDLTEGGLPAVTELRYLGRDTAGPAASDGPGFVWEVFEPARPEAFTRVLEATYSGSLDMPELDGLRSLDDIIESHQATGRYDPGLWHLGRLPGQPEAAAVVLLARNSVRATWEVSYLGLTPEARGRGLGREALEHAIELARPHAGRLELAVDHRNTPARRLYERAGFVMYDRRRIHFRVLP